MRSATGWPLGFDEKTRVGDYRGGCRIIWEI